MIFMAEAATATTEAQDAHAGQKAQAEAQAKPAKARRPAARKAKKQEQVVFAFSKRKESVARASARKGTGTVRVNSALIETVKPRELQMLMLRPLYISPIAKDMAAGVDITVSVHGGGKSSQAQAVGGAIARVLAGMSEGDTLRHEYMRYDRSLIIDDSRRVEPKKFLGRKARARNQTSYR